MRNDKSKSPLILMEQVIMVAVFALAATVCVKVFVQAELMSKRMCATDRAVVLCQTAAETLKAEKGSYEAVVRRLTENPAEGTITDRGLCIYYKEDWIPTEDITVSEYVLLLKEEAPERNVVNGTVQVLMTNDGTLLFELPVSRQEVAYE